MTYLQAFFSGLQAVLAWALAHPDEAAQTGIIIATGLGALSRWAVAKRATRFAQFVDALGRSAGRIVKALANVPAGMTVEEFKAQLIRAELRDQLAEYAGTAKKIGATPQKAENILNGEIDKLVAAAPIINIVAPEVKAPSLRAIVEHMPGAGLAGRGA